MPCRKTPAQAASFGESPWEASAAIIPVKASPMPPEAMYGFPVVLTKMSPFGVATTVRAPLRITVTRSSSARCRAESIRAASIDSIVSFVSRAISPGWGVRMHGAVAPCRVSASPDKAFSASASSRNGTLILEISSFTNAGIVSVIPSPGPTTITSAFDRTSIRAGIIPGVKYPFPPSGIPWVITSICFASTIGRSDSGVTTVMSPAPMRSAADPARHGAPVIPGDPPTMWTLPASPLWKSGGRTESMLFTTCSSSASVLICASNTARCGIPMS